MSRIFECKDEMPVSDNSPDVVRTALTMPEARRNMTPVHQDDTKSVRSTERPRFGHGY